MATTMREGKLKVKRSFQVQDQQKLWAKAKP